MTNRNKAQSIALPRYYQKEERGNEKNMENKGTKSKELMINILSNFWKIPEREYVRYEPLYICKIKDYQL